MSDRPTAVAFGVAALVAAALVLTRRVDAPAVALVLAVLGVRIAAGAAGGDTAMLGRLAATVPVWACLAIAASIRAGSSQVASIMDVNSVVGPSVVYQPALTAIGMALLVGSAIVAFAHVPIVVGAVSGRLDRAGVVVGAVTIVALGWGPTIRQPAELVAWTAGIIGVALSLAYLSPRVSARRVGKISSAVAVFALLLVSIGGSP